MALTVGPGTAVVVLALWLRFRSWPGVLLTSAAAWAVLVGFGPRSSARNPLGDSFIAIRLSVLVPALVCAVLILGVGDDVSASLGLRRARPWARALNLLAVHGLAFATLSPLLDTHGHRQVLVDVSALLGLGLIGRRLAGPVAAWALQVLVLIPHLVRGPAWPDSQAAWWAVLDGGTSVSMTAVALCVSLTGVALTMSEPPIGRRTRE